jgi:hypothetical protein
LVSRYAIVVHTAAGHIFTIRDTIQIATHHGLAVVEHALYRAREDIEAVTFDDTHHLTRSGPDPDHLRLHVASYHLGNA